MMRKSEIESLKREMARAHELIHEKRAFREGLELCAKVRAQCEEAGTSSAFVIWVMATAFDYLDEPAAAFEYAEEALRMDPLDPNYDRSFGVIVHRVRTALTAKERAPDDPSTATLYQLLAERNEADVDCHLTMARYHLHAGRPKDAARILDAVTLLNPSCAEAWEALEECARVIGDEALVVRARGEQAACGFKMSRVEMTAEPRPQS